MLALPCAYYSFPPNSRFLFLPLSPFLCDQRGGMRVELGRKYHLHWHHSFGWNAKSLQSIHITFMLFMSYLVSRVLLSVVYRFSNIDITKYHIDTSFQFLFPSFMALHWQLTRTYEDVTCVRKRNDYSLKKKELDNTTEFIKTVIVAPAKSTLYSMKCGFNRKYGDFFNKFSRISRWELKSLFLVSSNGMSLAWFSKPHKCG